MITFSGLCQYFSEITLYLATVRFIFGLIGEIQSSLPVAGIFLAAGIVSAFFSRFKGFIAYLPIVLIVPVFIMARSVADFVCLLPLAVILFFHIQRKRWVCDGVVLQGSLKAGLGMFLFVVLAAAVAGKASQLSVEAIPMFVLFMGLVILAMRVMRNEETGRAGPLFYTLNTLVVALLAAFGFLFSNSWLLNAVRSCFKALYDYVIGPLLMGFSYVVIVIPMALGWLLEKVEFKEPEPLEETLQGFFGNENMEQLFEENEAAAPPQWLPKIFAAIGIIAFLVVAFFIIRKLVDYSSGRQPSGGNLSRTAVSAEDGPKRRRGFRNTPADAVRACYRKYLDICEEYTIPVDGSIASDEIASRSKSHTGEDATDGLRDLWLPARYSESGSTEEDAKQAKQYLKNIKKKVKEE